MNAKNVLIVEDEAIIALELKLRLEEMGFCVKSVVHSAEQAIDEFQKQAPDVVFMDIILRGSDTGIDVAKFIRQKSKVPIIFLTGNTFLLHERLLKSLQPCKLISKPANDWELIEAIHALEKN